MPEVLAVRPVLPAVLLLTVPLAAMAGSPLQAQEVIPQVPTVPGLSADYLDGLDGSAFATVGHVHDDRYFTEAETDAVFLRQDARAADSDALDGLDSSAFAHVGHVHDDRYLTEVETDALFLRQDARAADSDALDGLDSSAFAPVGHGHDDRYLTPAQGDTRYAGAEHSHDGRYYPREEADATFLGTDATAADADALGGIQALAYPVTIEGAMLFIRGSIRADGTVAAGGPFHVTKTGTGKYTVEFTRPFGDTPTVLLTVQHSGSNPTTITLSRDFPKTAAQFSVVMEASAAYNGAWEFLAIGPR